MFLSLFRKKTENTKPIENVNVVETSKDILEVKDTIYGKNIKVLTQVGYVNLWNLLDLIRTIKDPEKPNTLEDLNVVYEDGIQVSYHEEKYKQITPLVF